MLRRIVGSVGFVLFLGSTALSIVSSPCATAQDTRISDPNWQLAVANGINDEGQIAGFGLLNGQFHGFLLTPTSGASQSATLAPSRAHLPQNVREWLALQRSGLDRSRLTRNIAF